MSLVKADIYRLLLVSIIYTYRIPIQRTNLTKQAICRCWLDFNTYMTNPDISFLSLFEGPPWKSWVMRVVLFLIIITEYDFKACIYVILFSLFSCLSLILILAGRGVSFFFFVCLFVCLFVLFFLVAFYLS